MAKFNNRAGSGDKGRSGSREDRPGRKGKEKEGDDKKKKDYKANRSFSKNKVFREIKETRDEKPRRSFGSDERRPFKRDFDKKTDREKPARDSDSGSYAREERKPFKRDFDKKDRGEDRPKRSFSEDKERRSFREDKPERKNDSEDRPRRNSREESSEERPKRNFKPDEERRSFRDDRPKRDGDREERPRKNFNDEDSVERPRKSRDSDDARPLKKAYNKEDKFSGFKRATSGFPAKPAGDGKDKKRRVTKPRRSEEEGDTKRVKYDDFEEGKGFSKKREEPAIERGPKKSSKPQNEDGLIRLNKYLSNAGIASRRDADNLIQSGTVKVNGVVIDQLGYKIKPGDKVTYGDAAVKSERKVYLLLNKPKDYITTVDDPRERKTVMELIAGACRERVYPVGRLDRNTTGLLLFTNDGDLTTKLTHPKFGVKKIYHVSLNKGLKPEDFKAMTEGVELEDGIVKADDLAFVGEGKKEVGIEIHSGRNRIVRRLFEHLGYDVIKLDRVVFAGLTKKDLPRGKHRFLTAKEISFLQMLG